MFLKIIRISNNIFFNFLNMKINKKTKQRHTQSHLHQNSIHQRMFWFGFLVENLAPFTLVSRAKMKGVQNTLAQRFSTFHKEEVANITECDIKREHSICHFSKINNIKNIWTPIIFNISIFLKNYILLDF
jgi:hypothetical protein